MLFARKPLVILWGMSTYTELKMEELTRFRMTTHPVEFDMYYSL